MARKSQQAFAKRQRELRKVEKAAQKRQRRVDRKDSQVTPAEEAPPPGEDDQALQEGSLGEPV